ncbi:c-type cytochrome biogenesis protein CcmI [Tabrizicola sp.]|uniref:c-type cytochrome biogenesis protein CcmI n=1 Tax=Tabrizicola sp. TaxID=2005166 RepID=UPI002736C4A5|nr:c-type cytochrome biogenesis protein CcmI [Tabrizicola sp.]MDP3197983.1 c-type cytochrome biogenesis protein CcmI [Tabrizicola sp.]
MTAGVFWAVAIGLAALVAYMLIGALRRVPGQNNSAEADLAVYRDQLAEIERDLARATIAAPEAERLRAEVGKRVIEADKARMTGSVTAGSTSTAVLVAVIIAVVVPGGMAAYWALGAPGYPDMALEPRLAGLDDAIRARPSQEAELATQGRTRDMALDTRLSAELAAATDTEALRARFQQHFEAGEMQAAVRVQERLIALQGEAASSQGYAMLALALTLEAQGYVSPEAEGALRASLQRDASNEIARYLVGEMFRQGARFDRAFQFWRPIAESGTPGSPFVADVRAKIEQVAELAGVRYALPASVASGPTAGDVAAAAEMAPEERQAMIEGMVAQLSDRLATEGGNVEDWNRLIRSLAILERLPEAQKIYDEAKDRFQGRPAELSFLRLAAVETGLSP